MNGFTKFIIGGIATSLMAMASHSMLGMGGGFIDRLESDARTALGNANGGTTELAFMRDPALRRIAVLSGDADAATRERLLAAVRAVPGVAGAVWATDGAAVAAAAPAEAPATTAEVTNCQTTVDTAINGQTIQFDTGAATIKPESESLIAALATALAPCEGTMVEVAGHTDATGNPASNDRLSQARADAVVAALVARSVPPARLAARGYGSTQPRDEGRSPVANAANRRIEFKVSAAGAATAAPAAAAEGE